MNFVKNLPNTELSKKQNLLKQFAFIFLLLIATLKVSSQTTYTWSTTATNGSWNAATNWTPSGVPASGDNVIVVASSNSPVYDGTVLNHFTLTSGNIDLGGNELEINGNATFTNGTVSNGRIKARGTNTVFTNGTFNCKVSSVTSNAAINGGTFNDSVAITKNGTADQNMNGNATFNAPFNLRIESSGRMQFAGNMVFNGVLSLYNGGFDNFILESSSANTYNNDVYLTIAGNTNGDIRLGVGADVVFKGDVYVSSIGGTGDIYLAQGATRHATLSAGKKIYVASSGFNLGSLWLQNVTQVGAASQSITLTGTAALRLGPSTTFDGKIAFQAPQVFLSGITTNDSAVISKVGSGNNYGTGGNIFNSYASISNKASSNGILRTYTGNTFNGTVELNNESVSDILLGMNVGSGSTFNGDVYVNKSGNGSVNLAYAGNNFFNGDIIVSNTKTVGGIYFCNTAPATATLAAGKEVKVGAAGFTGGTLSLTRITQMGSSPQSVTLTGTAALRLGPATTFNGKIEFAAPQMFLDGVTTNDSVFVSKTGSVSNSGSGGNTFNSYASISNKASSNGYLRTALGNTFNGTLELNNASVADILLGANAGSGSTYNGDVILNKSGNGIIYVAHTGSNTFAGDIVVNNTTNVGGIYICNTTPATATLAAGKEIKVGAAGFTGGTLSLARITQMGSLPQSLALTGTAALRLGPATTFNSKIDFAAPQMYLDGVTANDSAFIEKNGAAASTGLGANTFNGFASITNSAASTGFLRTTAGNTFNGTFVLNNGSNSDVILGVTGGSSYNGDVYVSKTGIGRVSMAYASSSSFNGNIELSNTNSTNGIYFCELGSATATLANGKQIKVGGAGFTSGVLSLPRFTQAGSTPQVLSLTGNSSLYIGPATTFNGKVNITTPQIFLNGIVANDSTFIEKNGLGSNAGTGGNTFNSYASIINKASSNGYIRTNAGNTFNGTLELKNESVGEILLEYTSGGTYNGDVYLTKTGNGNIRMAYAGATSFNGNVELNCTNTTGGILFCEQASASATLATGKKFTSGTVTNGLITIQRVTQNGSTVQDFNFGGNASLTFGANNAFAGDVNVSLTGTGILTASAGNLFSAKTDFLAPQLLLNGATFSGASTIEKNGAGTNTSNGGNKFLSDVSITNSGTGILVMGGTNADTFAQKTILTNTNSATIQMANNHTNKTTYFGDTVIVSNTSTAAAGSPGIRFTEGNNTYCYFNGVVIASNAGTGATNLIRFQNGTGETVFNRRSYFNNNCIGASSTIQVSRNGNTNFNDNAYCTASAGTGINFGSNSGTSVFAPTYKVLVGDAGYSATSFVINGVSQSGVRNPTILELSGNTLLTVSNSTFSDETDFIAPQLTFQNNTFNNVTRITKTGATNNISVGGNVFNDSARITNESTASLCLANTSSDVYNGDVTFVKSSSGVLNPAYNTEVIFKKNISVEGISDIVFNGMANGSVTLSGSDTQDIMSASNRKPIIRNLKVNKNASYPVVLKTPVDVSSNGTLILTSGIVKSDSANTLTLLNNASANMGSATAFIDGLLNYQMAAVAIRTLNFPIGSGSDYHPVQLTVRHNNAANYTYSGKLINQSARDLNRALSDSIEQVSDIRYWRMERLLTATMAKSNANLVGNQTITLYYDSSDFVTDAANLRIVKNTSAMPNKWISIGGFGSANGSGYITSTSTPSAFNSFSDFGLGNLNGGGNPLPVTLVSLTATAKTNAIEVAWETATELNNKGFSVQRSTDGRNFQVIGWVDGNGTTSQAIQYTYTDVNVQPNTIYYYRLKQIDYDEHTELTKVVSAMIQNTSTPTVIWGTISPNANASANLILNLANEGVVIAKTFSLSGALISSTEYNASKGLNQIEINFEQMLAQGMYITEVSINNETKKIKWFYNK